MDLTATYSDVAATIRHAMHTGAPVPDDGGYYDLYPRVYDDPEAEYAGGSCATLAQAVKFLREYEGPGFVRLSFLGVEASWLQVTRDGWLVLTVIKGIRPADVIPLFHLGATPRQELARLEARPHNLTLFWSPDTGDLRVKVFRTVEEQRLPAEPFFSTLGAQVMLVSASLAATA